MRAFPSACAAALAGCLALPAAARAHGTVTPAFAASGEAATVTIEAPNERRRAMTGLAVVLPEGLSAAAAGQPATPGWRLRAGGRRAVWTGGSVPPGRRGAFSLRLRAEGEPRALVVRLEQRYPDGGVVVWQPSFTVVPAATEAPSQHLGRALVAALAGLAVIAASLAAGRRLRRASAPET